MGLIFLQVVFPEYRIFYLVEGSGLCRSCLLFLPVPSNDKFHRKISVSRIGSWECCHQRIKIELHCRVRRGIFDPYLITLLGGIDRRMVALWLCIIESPDGSWRFVSVRETTMIKNPDSNKIALEWFNLIGITSGGCVREINHWCNQWQAFR